MEDASDPKPIQSCTIFSRMSSSRIKKNTSDLAAIFDGEVHRRFLRQRASDVGHFGQAFSE